MDKVKQLFVRACKSRNPGLRLEMLYRRFYLLNADDETMNFSITGILANICDEYLNIKTSQIVSDLCPGNHWKFGIEDNDNYWQSIAKVLTNYIRLTDKDAFPGLTPPAVFRQDRREEQSKNPETASDNHEPWADPILISDEDEIWQITGALDQASHDGLYIPRNQPDILKSISLNTKDPFKDLSDVFFYQRTGQGFLGITSKREAIIVLSALCHAKNLEGFHGSEWCFEPSPDIIRSYIKVLRATLNFRDLETA